MDQAQKDYFYSKSFTLKGRIFYPELFQPKPNDQGRLKYSVMFGWPLQDDQTAKVQEIGRFLQEAKQRFFAQVPDQFFVKPIKNFNTYVRQDGKPNHEFLRDSYWMNLSASEGFPPQVVDQGYSQVLDQAQVYSGRNALVNFNFYSYQVNGKAGISANVSAVMLLEGGERESGSGGINLNEAFGSFAADMGFNTGGSQGGQQYGGQQYNGGQGNGSQPQNNGGQQQMTYPSNGQGGYPQGGQGGGNPFV